MIQVSVRQNRDGAWWASTTHNCHDIFEEGKTIETAKELMMVTLARRGHTGGILFSTPKLYHHEVAPKIDRTVIGYANSRIDNNPFA